MKDRKIAIVDDQAGARRLFATYLEDFSPQCFASADELLGYLKSGGDFDLAVVDIQMPSINGIELMRILRKNYPHITVIIASGKGEKEEVALALKEGAFYFIDKEYARVELPVAVKIALKITRLEEKNRLLLSKIKKEYSFSSITGSSKAMQGVIEQAKRAVLRDFPVLIQGESGTGKELMARCLHNESSRSDGPFIGVNISEIPKDLVASALFGHKKGSFTGANEDKKGLFQGAHGGVIFLDEIGELREDIQVQLLRFLQEREIRPIGAIEAKKVDIWIIAATHRDLAYEIREGRFRYDLYQRLNVINLRLPPLRERPEDIPELVKAILKKEGFGGVKLTEGAMEKLGNYSWEGNIRELENVLRRAITFATTNKIASDDIDFQPVGLQKSDHILPEGGMNLKEYLETIEKSMIVQALKRSGGIKKKAAQLLGIEQHNFLHKVNKKYRIEGQDEG